MIASTTIRSLFSVAIGVVTTAVASAAITTTESVYHYNVCNGLSNQLLYHSASIATAVQQGYQEVAVPDYFIVNGVQETDADVLPSSDNSVEFGVAFDTKHFLSKVEELGIRARLVQFSEGSEQPACAGMAALGDADPDLVLHVLQAFRPSVILQALADGITSALGGDEDVVKNSGICVHYRDGQDWQEHCERWGAIRDGVYRGNCLGTEPFTDSLQSRVTGDDYHWIYYCGDEADTPAEFAGSVYPVMSREQLMSAEAKEAVQELKPGMPVRDLWALIDFSVCQGLSHFVGNSVSTFSALQIALRDGNKSYWYNSQGIPLSNFWNVYHIPIVYTYTELSAATGKHMLQASIASVRRHMPHSKIDILYHGDADIDFQAWLLAQDVTIHAHDPSWKSSIEEMRLKGDISSSHLFAHAGNYFGTWQRIDVPLFVDSEYVLLLDSDTVVNRPFTLADFGQDLTRSFAMSSEIDVIDSPANAGVMLMNVPYMRKTYDDFMEFITGHIHSPKFNNEAPSDQGAYLEYYQDVRFLSRCFNFKPYYKLSDIECDSPYIVHFHGAKPHDYLNHLRGEFCQDAFRGLCFTALRRPSLCLAFQAFAQSSQSVDEDAYCNAAFAYNHEVNFCRDVMYALVDHEDECHDITNVLSGVAHEIDPRIVDVLANANGDAVERMLQDGSSEAPSQAPTGAPCSGFKKACNKSSDCCNSVQKCYNGKCLKCIKKKQKCKKTSECCKGGSKTVCDKESKKCLGCAKKKKKCTSKKPCCKGKCKEDKQSGKFFCP